MNTGPARLSLWKELALAVALSVAVATVSGIFDVQESLYAFTRRWERLQLDELPMALTAFALCLLWLYARRYAQARAAEAALAAALAENRALARAHLESLEAERKHLARELHDELGQYLNAIKLDAVSLGEGRLPPEQVAAAGARIVHNADHVHGAVSGMIRRLRPVGLDELGLAAALEHCVEQWRQRLPSVQWSLVRQGELDGLGEAVDLAVYRVVQEAVTNASRHAQAGRIDVRVARVADAASGRERLDISVIDDGRGMDATQPAQGFGLAGMRERLELLGGELRVRSAPGEGAIVSASLPLAGAP